MALTDKQRREVENLWSATVDIERRLTNAINEAEAVLPPGAIPGMLGEAADMVEAVREILDEMVKKMAYDHD